MSEEENNAKLLAMNEGKLQITLDGVTKDDLMKYTIQQFKDTYQKPKRLEGRLEGEQYIAPLGLFNLGNNSLYYKEDVKKDENEEEDEETGDTIEIKNNVKMVDGKLVFTEEDQGKVDAEEEKYKFNIEVKNDIPYQIYRKILHFGRLTIQELYDMWGAISKEMFLIIINDMINKRFLKQVKELDRDIIFNDNPTTLEDAYTVVEKEIETLEIVGENERRQVLEEK